MTDNLFKKAVCLTDVHFGRSGGSPTANQDNLDFIEWFVEEGKTFGADTCIMLGDWHDSRHSLLVSTMHYSLRGMEMLNDAFSQVVWIPGNHDLLYRHKRDVSSVAFAKHLPNIRIFDDPTTLGNVTILPWLVNDEPKKVKSIKSRYIFGHLELPNFMMNAKVPMPFHGDSITAEDFTENEYVFSGHFHFRQAKGRVVYIGNVMPFNFADVHDGDRGMMFLEWGKEPYFKAWPEQPMFSTFKLSELINTPEKLLRPKLTARCTMDVPISFEEAQVIKETYVESYGLRKIELVHQPRQGVDVETFEPDVAFQTVDQIVTEGLMSVQSIGLRAEVLVDIYKSLPDV